MATNWIRSTTIQIGTIEIDQLDIDFAISSTAIDQATAATATITVYNMAPRTAKRISNGDLVKIWAGYTGDTGLIYLGRVLTSEGGRDGADTYIKITCTDYSWPKSMQPRIWPKGSPAGDIIRQLYADASLPAGPIINDMGVTLSTSYTTDPNGKTTLDHLISAINGDPNVLAQNVSVHHTILGGQACVIASNQTSSDAQLISSKTGLISTAPDTSDTADRTAIILLNWHIQADNLIRLESASTTGWFKVISYTHRSDASRYQTDLTLKSMDTKT